MDRRAFVTGLGAVLAAPLGAGAQQAGRVYRIGILESSPLWEPFHQRLRELGYVEGRNLIVERRAHTEGQPEQISAMARQLVEMRVEVIATAGAVATGAAKQATTTIPIVMIAGGDPVEIGLVQSLARPGGNMTGLAGNASIEIIGKCLGLLKETIPSLRRVAILLNPNNAIYAQAVRSDASVAARSLDVQPQFLEARDRNEFDAALRRHG